MKIRIALAAFMGFLAYWPCYIIYNAFDFYMPHLMAVCSGVIFACFVLVYFLIHKKYTDSKYAKAEENIKTKFFLKANGNFNLCGKVKNCNIYFCEDRVVILCLEKCKFSMEELPVSIIHRVLSDTMSRVHIHTLDDRLYVITTPDASRINDELMKRPDWLNK